MHRPVGFAPPLVQIVGPTDNWILQKLSAVLVSKLPYASFAAWRPAIEGKLAYYVNYALYNEPSGLIDVGFFTHRDDSHDFLLRAQRMDACICMARMYADWLQDKTHREVVHIPMGFDAYRYRPSLVLGVIGKLDHPRKGRHLVEHLQRLPFVEMIMTDGRLPEDSLRDVYQRVDYVLIPASVEGGPMSLFESLAMGKPVIAPENVGAVSEFAGCEQLLLYPAGDAVALEQVVTACFERKKALSMAVADRSWDQWAEDHHRFFMKLLSDRGVDVPLPGPGFRFGLIQDLVSRSGKDFSSAADISGLELIVDRTAAYLYYGQVGDARMLLEASLLRFPVLQQLLSTLPAS